MSIAMTADRARLRRRRVAGSAELAIALIFFLVVVIVALRANHVTPPPIAEFAPQANEVIKQAPQNQGTGNGVGQGNGRGNGNGVGPGVGNGPGGGGQIAALDCVGDPPRQIEDPQSPPCVPYWKPQSNGCKTAPQGVDCSTIKIAWVDQNGQTNGAEAPALQKFFNSRFELYGRQIHLQMYTENGNDVAGQQGLAKKVAADGNFASTEFTDTGGMEYHQELARLHVVSAYGFEANPTEADMNRYDPYLWSYQMAADNMLRTIGNWYCGVLNGHRASHAGSPTYQQTIRNAGIVYHTWDPSQKTDLTPLLHALAGCGITNPYRTTGYANKDCWGCDAADLSHHNITTVICICDFIYWRAVTEAADGNGYFPEWLLSGFGGGDGNWTFHFGDPDPNQAAHTFGLTFQPMQVSLANDPMWWGWSEGSQGTAQQPTDFIQIYQGHLLYRSLLEIMSGIQMAGPNLNPQTFADALHRTVFPNPDLPIMAGHVDFFNGSHAMTVDAAQWWYDPSAPSPWSAQGDPAGTLCYVDRGRRFGIDDWSGVPDQFQQQPCFTGA